MGQSGPKKIGLLGGVGWCALNVHAQSDARLCSDTFIIHYVHSKRNVRISAISSSCRKLLVVEAARGEFTDRDGAETITVRLNELWL